MTGSELRKKFIEFYKNHQHAHIPSAPLLPENDPTTLFTGSGMQPLVPYLLGQTHPAGKRLVNSQKSFRSQDIEDVGDNRHTTFFEMLGNWSLGDYFKESQIPFIFSFLTDTVGLNPERLYVTVYRGNPDLNVPRDETSAQVWQKLFSDKNINAGIIDFSERDGMQNGRIFYYDDKKNWWSRSGVPANMPVGEPGGPDSEVFWDFGAHKSFHENSIYKNEPCHVNCDCGRFMEIGNSVFMEYRKTEQGFEPLPQKNVDFGGGLERMVAASQDTPDVFLIDFFAPLKAFLEEKTGHKYNESEEMTRSFRVILDHLRAATFLIGDNALPSNKDQGYFTRRLLRRAVRFAYQLDLTENFCAQLAGQVIDIYKETYVNLSEKRDFILQEMEKEETQFRKTLEKGLKEFEKLSETLQKNALISGEQAFHLYDTYGFPLEMTKELAQEKGFTVNEDEFHIRFEDHKNLSRAGSEQKFKGGLIDHSESTTKLHTATHLLHQALRTVLGNHVGQKGSNITPERLRFDFSHPDKMTEEQIKQVESIVNEQIQKALPVSYQEMSVDEAKSYGALGFFEHKYGDQVKVYTMGDATHPEQAFSKEICGGPHVENTSVLGHFKILKEEACSAGVRRIKAIVE